MTNAKQKFNKILLQEHNKAYYHEHENNQVYRIS
jgi:hypothetical protein